jgi:hypothetical protein
MPRANIRIRLTGRAVDVALSPRRAGAVELNPQARVILQHAEIDRADAGARIVICTVPEARTMLDHFSGLVHVLIGLADTDAAIILADARDAVRRALVVAGG